VKFPCSGNDTVHTCPSIQHILPTGQVGHEDEDHHKLKYTEEIEQFALPRIRAQMKVTVIMSGANHVTHNIAPWRLYCSHWHLYDASCSDDVNWETLCHLQ
jgi:hypothetical protein